VDYTLTNQSGHDFSGQDLAQTSFAGVVGRKARFQGADLHGAILTQATLAVQLVLCCITPKKEYGIGNGIQ